MTRGRGNIFDNRKILHEMLALRAKGLGLSELGRKYNVDHSTIFYHIKKSGMATVQRVVQKPKDVDVAIFHITPFIISLHQPMLPMLHILQPILPAVYMSDYLIPTSMNH